MTSGGLRPGAPQNNFGVSATGGNGSAKGQPIRVAPGGPYGSRTASVQQQSGAPMAAGAPSASAQVPVEPTPPTVHALTGDTGVSGHHITTGVDFGRGAGSSVLPGAPMTDTRTLENTQIVKNYLPALLDAMKSPMATDSFKRFVNSLMKETQNVPSSLPLR